MEVNTVRCPECGKYVPSGKFCNNCTAELPKSAKNTTKRKDGLHEKKVSFEIDGEKTPQYSIYYRTIPEFEKKKAEKFKELTRGMTLEDAADIYEDYILPSMSPNARKNKRCALKRCREFFKGYGLKEIEPEQIEQFYDHVKKLKGGLTIQSVKEAAAAINGVYEYFCKELKYYNPVKNAKLPKDCKPQKPRQYPTKEELEIIESCADLEPFGLFLYTIRYSGCRIGECFALEKRDIDFKNQLVHISKSVYFAEGGGEKGTKTQDSNGGYDRGARSVPLLPNLADALQPVLTKLKPHDRIFGHLVNDWSNDTEFYKRLNPFKEKIGLTCDQHSLRHAYCNLLFELMISQNLPINFMSIAKWMGHMKKDGVTPNTKISQEIYTHYTAELEEEAHRKALIGWAEKEKKQKENNVLRVVSV